MEDLKLLYAKEAIFRMILQFHHASKRGDSDTLYIYNYYESALEAAFNVLGIEENCIPLWDFCKMWEDNNRAVWAINFPNEPYRSFTADVYFKSFVDDYELWQRDLYEED